tara:strand:- start:479 stop:3019 length:2541 start_codon:yes stop_codon:yes gene_type:complete
VAYKAEIDVKVRNLGSISQLEQKLSSISKNVNAINKKNLKGGGKGSGAAKDPLKDELASLRLQNTALSNINRAQRAANKLKAQGRNLDDEMAALKKVSERSVTDSLNQDRKIVEEQKKKIQNAEKLILTTQKQQKAQAGVAKATERTLTAQERINVLRLSGSANKLAGGMGGFIDSQRKGVGPGNLLALPSSKDIKGRGIERLGETVRDKAGEFTASSVEKAEFFEKRRNAAIERGIEANNKLVGSERIRNRQTIRVNRAIEKNNRQTLRQANNLIKLGDKFGQLGTNIAKFQDGLLKTRGPGGSMLALPSAQMLDTRVKATGQAGGFSRAIPRFRMPSPTRGFDFESALISGGFPLLFGQGPGVAAAGTLGGGVGGMFGGMGGFAGGIAATALVTSIQNAINAISELGQALGPFTQNSQAAIDALGLQGSAEEARIKLIEQTKGKTAAFNAAMNLMSTQIGQKGVDAIRQFGDTTRLLGGQFTLALTKLQAFTAGVANFIIRITGLQEQLEADAATQTVAAAAGEGDAEAKALVARRKAAESMRGQGGEGARRKALLAQISAEEKIFAIRRNTTIEADNLTQKFDALGISLKAEKEESKRILELRKQGINPELAKTLASIEKEGAIAKDNLQVEIDKLLQKQAKEGELSKELQTRLTTLEKIQDEIDEEIDSMSELAEATDKLNESTKDMRTNFERIGESIASGVTDNITAAIQGTKTLGDAAKAILNDLSSSLIRLGVNTLLSKIPGFGGLPILGTRSKGGPVRTGGSFVVGEKGPELFVPKRSGTIIPNDKLGGGSTNINVNVDASGSSVQGDAQQSKELGRVISAAIQSELLKQRRPGGLLR